MKVHAWIAVLSMGAGGATASAASIEGSLSFPGGFLPAMIVYARDLDGSALRSVATSESQSTFKLDLPPGRYAFFAEPSEPGAPEIYGAFTQAVACRQRDAQQPCEDHSLLIVTVGNEGIAAAQGAEEPAIHIADWPVPDELAEQFDQLLGHRNEPNVQELGAPRFSEYPAHADLAAPPALDYTALAGSAQHRQRIREATPSAPTFAGSIAVAQVPCGTGCVDVILVDWKTGKVQAPAVLARVPLDLPCRSEESIMYRRDSRLLSLSRRRDSDVVTQFFLWKPDTGMLSQTAEYQRSIERFCALQGP